MEMYYVTGARITVKNCKSDRTTVLSNLPLPGDAVFSYCDGSERDSKRMMGWPMYHKEVFSCITATLSPAHFVLLAFQKMSKNDGWTMYYAALNVAICSQACCKGWKLFYAAKYSTWWSEGAWIQWSIFVHNKFPGSLTQVSNTNTMG